MDNAAFATILEELATDIRMAEQPGFLDSVRPAVILKRWSLSFRTVATLQGFAVGHPILGNKMIDTSELFFLDPERALARTLSRWYRLSDPASLHQTSSPAEH